MLIFLIINIVVITFFSMIALCGNIYEEYKNSKDYSKSLSFDGIDAEMSVLELLQWKFLPQSFDINEANHRRLKDLETQHEYDNYKFQVVFSGGTQDIIANVEKDNNKIAGTFIFVPYGQGETTGPEAIMIKSHRFYINIVDELAILRIENGDSWVEKTIDADKITNYEMSRIIQSLLTAEFSSFPTYDAWHQSSLTPQNHFITTINFGINQRVDSMKLDAPESIESNSLFDFMTTNYERIKITYRDDGYYGQVSISEPNWDECDIQVVEDFSMIFNNNEHQKNITYDIPTIQFNQPYHLIDELNHCSYVFYEDGTVAQWINDSSFEMAPFTIYGDKIYIDGALNSKTLTINWNGTMLFDISYNYISDKQKVELWEIKEVVTTNGIHKNKKYIGDPYNLWGNIQSSFIINDDNSVTFVNNNTEVVFPAELVIIGENELIISGEQFMIYPDWSRVALNHVVFVCIDDIPPSVIE